MLLSGLPPCPSACHIYYNCDLLLFVSHNYVWLAGQQLLVNVEVKVPEDLGLDYLGLVLLA